MKNSKIPRSNPFELLANNIFILKYAYIYIYPYAIHKERVLLWKTQSLKMRWDLVCSCTNQWHFSPPERAEPTTIQVSSEHHLSDHSPSAMRNISSLTLLEAEERRKSRGKKHCPWQWRFPAAIRRVKERF